MMKKRTKIILGVLAALILLPVILFFAYKQKLVNSLAHKAERAVTEQTHGRYRADLGRVRVALASASVTLSGLTLTRDSTVQDSADIAFLNQYDLDVHIERLRLNGFDWWGFLRRKDIGFDGIEVEGPRIDLRQLAATPPPDSARAEAPDTTAARKNAVRIGQLSIREGAFRFLEKDQAQAKLDLAGLQVELGEIELPREGEPELPWNDLAVTLDMAEALVGDYTADLRAEGLHLEPGTLRMDSLYYGTRISPAELNNKHGYLKSWIHTTLRDIRVEGIDLEAIAGNEIVDLEKAIVNSADFRLIRDRQIYEPPPTYKPLPVEMVRDIPIPVALDSLLIHDTDFQVEILSPEANLAGLLRFEQSDIRLTNLTNRDSLLAIDPDMKVHAESQVMGKGKVVIDLVFHLDRPNGDFDVAAYVYPLDLPLLNLFFEREVFMSISEGRLGRIQFAFRGDNDRALGKLDFEYNGLKFSRLNPNQRFQAKKRRSGLVVALANLAIPNNRSQTQKRYKQGTIELERRKDRDFIAFLVDALADGILASWGFENIIKPPDDST